MKKALLTKIMLLLCALIAGSSSVWANEKTSTLNFTAACGGSGTADDGIEWTITSDASESTFSNTDGIHYGTNSASVQYITLTSEAFSNTYTIKSVVVTTRDAQATAAITVKVGTTSFTTGDPAETSATATNTSTAYTFTGSVSGDVIEVKVDRGSALTKAIYVKSIVVTYDDNKSLTNPTISFPNATYTNIFGESFTAPTPTCDSDGTKTYSSSNTEVAEVSASTGAVTIKKKGFTTITLNVAESATYSSGSASYVLKVVGAIEDGVFNFNNYQDYGSGTELSTDYNGPVQSKTWTAGNLTLTTAGRNLWYYDNTKTDDPQLRLYNVSGNKAAGGITITENNGKVITKIVFTGTRCGNLSPDCGTNNSGTWYGKSNSVVFSFSGSSTIQINTITVTYMDADDAKQSVTTTREFSAFCSATQLDFTGKGIEVYKAKVNTTTGAVTLTKLDDNIAPAGVGVILKGTPTTVEVPFAETSPAVSNNELRGVTKDTEVAVSVGTEPNVKYNYILQNGAFYKATGAKLRAGKAYLQTTYNVSATSAPCLSIEIEGETTGINEVNGSESKVNGEYYNLAGQRVANPTKGLYIVNGKKVIIK